MPDHHVTCSSDCSKVKGGGQTCLLLSLVAPFPLSPCLHVFVRIPGHVCSAAPAGASAGTPDLHQLSTHSNTSMLALAASLLDCSISSRGFVASFLRLLLLTLTEPYFLCRLVCQPVFQKSWPVNLSVLTMTHTCQTSLIQLNWTTALLVPF